MLGRRWLLSRLVIPCWELVKGLTGAIFRCKFQGLAVPYSHNFTMAGRQVYYLIKMLFPVHFTSALSSFKHISWALRYHKFSNRSAIEPFPRRRDSKAPCMQIMSMTSCNFAFRKVPKLRCRVVALKYGLLSTVYYPQIDDQVGKL